jgi:hypothetical protein
MLLHGGIRDGWDAQSVIRLGRDKVTFTADDLKAVLDYIPKDGIEINIPPLGKRGDANHVPGRKLTVTREMLETALSPYIGTECAVIVDGNHRAVMLMILGSLGYELTPNVTVGDVTKEAGMLANMTQGAYAALRRGENLAAVVALRVAGKLKKESDLAPYYKRGMQQKLWAQSTLVRAGVSVDDAAKLDKETARNCADAPSMGERVAKAVEALAKSGTPVARAIAAPKLAAYAKAIRDDAARAGEVLTLADVADILDAVAVGNVEDFETRLGILTRSDD